jgi:hypothetical protein
MKLRLIHFAGLHVQNLRNRLERVTAWLNAAYSREMKGVR